MLETILATLATYLAASASFPQLIARAHGVDLHKVGTRNLGASNLAREVGRLQGLTGGLLDALKPPLAMLACQIVGTSRETELACGVVAIVAQQWPLWHRFDGGRGNATAMALLIAVSLRASLLVAPVALLGIGWGLVHRLRLRRRLLSRGTPLGLILAFALYPLAALAWGEAEAAIVGLATTVLVALRRLTAGIRDDLRVSPEIGRIVWNRLLFDRSEGQRRALDHR